MKPMTDIFPYSLSLRQSRAHHLCNSDTEMCLLFIFLSFQIAFSTDNNNKRTENSEANDIEVDILYHFPTRGDASVIAKFVCQWAAMVGDDVGGVDDENYEAMEMNKQLISDICEDLEQDQTEFYYVCVNKYEMSTFLAGK